MEAAATATDVIRFPDQPDIIPVTETMYELRRDYSYTTLSGVEILLRKGFRSDLLSAPRFTWSTIGLPPDGLYRPAALIHDALYSSGGKTLNKDFTRAEADELLLEIMTRLGVDAAKREEAYYAVRMFGKSHWVPA